MAKDGPGLLNLGGERDAVGRDVELEQAERIGFVGTQAFLDLAAGGDDLVAAADELLDHHLADARGGAGDEPDLRRHCWCKWRGALGLTDGRLEVVKTREVR